MKENKLYKYFDGFLRMFFVRKYWDIGIKRSQMKTLIHGTFLKILLISPGEKTFIIIIIIITIIIIIIIIIQNFDWRIKKKNSFDTRIIFILNTLIFQVFMFLLIIP